MPATRISYKKSDGSGLSVSVGTPHDEEWVQLEVTVMSTVPSGSKDQGMCHDISRPDNTAH